MNVMIVGLPMSGKSTLFSAVTGLPPDPHAPPDAHSHAIVNVPDHRLAFLAELEKSKKITESTIDLWDIPGCSLDDPKGAEDWRRQLPTVRQADLLVVVVRDFMNDAVPEVQDRIDPKADFAGVWDELIFADLDVVTTRVEKLEKALTKPTRTHDEEKRELALLTRCREALESETPLSSVLTTEEDRRHIKGFAFLTLKPLVCVRNVSDDQTGSAEPLNLEHVESSIALSASIEAEIAMLDEQDRPAFMADLGLDEPARDRLIRTCFSAGGLITFLTMGPEESRAWTIPAGTTAVEAAGSIHSDIARGFIRAETVGYEELVSCGDLKAAKAAGRVRKEGKSYVVRDGDVLYILHSS